MRNALVLSVCMPMEFPWKPMKWPVCIACRLMQTHATMPIRQVAIKGRYAGRIEAVLFAKESPLWAENARLLATGGFGSAPRASGRHILLV